MMLDSCTEFMPGVRANGQARDQSQFPKAILGHPNVSTPVVPSYASKCMMTLAGPRPVTMVQNPLPDGTIRVVGK